MTAYFDCFSGIAGDMTVAALLDAGLDFDALKAQLDTLNLPGFRVEATKVTRSGIAGTHFNVHVTEEQTHGRHLSDIESLIGGSGLPDVVKQNAIAVFRRLGAAEAKVHGEPIERIHFHEVGAIDSIVDIVAACAGLHLLGVTRILASPLPAARGFVKSAHGIIPLPAPATSELCIGIPTVPADVEGELVTPTGAALLVTLAESFGPPPAMTTSAIGYGAGTKDFPDRPNMLRVLIGEEPHVSSGWNQDELVLLETNIDDLNPQVYDHVMALSFAAGALDVWLTPIQMKKNRPGILLSALVSPVSRDAVLNVWAGETTTLGVRVSTIQRWSLPREIVKVQTAFGELAVKVARLPGGGRKAHPEYEDARRVAAEKNVPLVEILSTAEAAFRTLDAD